MTSVRDKQIIVDSFTPVNYTTSSTKLGDNIEGIDGALATAGGSTDLLVRHNKAMVANTTASDGDKATDTLVLSTPANDSYVMVTVNGQGAEVGDGVKTKDCYFSADAGATARAIADIAGGDTLHWNGTIAGYELSSSLDEIDFHYLGPESSGLLTSLEAFWPMHESSGDRFDVSGNGHTLTDTNTVGSGVGVIGTAADFETDNDESLVLATPIVLAEDAPYTIMLWFNAETAANVRLMGNEFVPGSYARWFGSIPGAFTFHSDSNTSVPEPNTATSTGTWQQFLVTCDGSDASNLNFYVDGVLEPTSPETLAISKHTVRRFADIGGANTNYDGLMQLVGVWNRELTAAEVTELYNSGSALDYPF